MITSLNALQVIQVSNRGSDRLAAIKSLDSPFVRKFFRYALDPAITFGMKKIPEYTRFRPARYLDEGINDGWETDLFSLLDRLASRDLTGNAAADEVAQFLRQCGPLKAMWTERIIRQDLRLDISAKSINKVLPGCIKLFSVPLARPYDEVTESYLRSKQWAIQAKLDGARCVASINSDRKVELLSRSGKTWGPVFDLIKQILMQWCQNDINWINLRFLVPGLEFPVYLDGEIVLVRDGRIHFQGLQKLMMADTVPQYDGVLKYVVFGVSYGEDWSKYTYAESLNITTALVEAVGSPLILPVPTMAILPGSAISQDFLAKTSAEAVSQGYEGLILRSMNDTIERKKGKKILKKKIYKDSEAKICGFVEGQGKHTGMLGAAVCEDDRGVRFEVGTGFSDDERYTIWNNQDQFMGKIITIHYFELTEAGVPRHPSFWAFRDEKDMDIG